MLGYQTFHTSVGGAMSKWGLLLCESVGFGRGGGWSALAWDCIHGRVSSPPWELLLGPASLHLMMVAGTVPCSLPMGLEARLGGALTPPGFRQQQLWNVCSPSLLSVRALWMLGVSSQIARQGQSAVQSKGGGGAGLGFSAGWFSFRSGHVCAHRLRRACGGWYQGWEALRPGGQQRESCSRSDVQRLTHCASPAFLLSHSSDVSYFVT